MRKPILAIFAIICTSSLRAQTIDEIRDFAGKNQWDNAKKGIDKWLAAESNNKKGEGWYLKAVIYNSIAKDSVLSANNPTARNDAFIAYKKYLELEPIAHEGALNEHATLFDLSFGNLEWARRSFQEKKFTDALNGFRNAETIEDYIVQKGFTYKNFSFAAFDTQLYVNIAASAFKAGREDIAIQYYQRLADKKIVTKGYNEIYRYLVDQFNKKGDRVNREKYLAIGRELYPNDDFLCQVGLAEVAGNPKKLFAKYEELINGSCNTYSNNYNYAVELYNYCFAQEKRPEDFATFQSKIPDELKRAIAINPAPEANMLMCRYQFGLINDLMDAYNNMQGTKPDELKKKSDLNVQVGARYEDTFPYINAVYDALSAKKDLSKGERGSLKTACNMLVEYWTRRKDTVKAKEYQDKLQSIGN